MELEKAASTQNFWVQRSTKFQFSGDNPYLCFFIILAQRESMKFRGQDQAVYTHSNLSMLGITSCYDTKANKFIGQTT